MASLATATGLNEALRDADSKVRNPIAESRQYFMRNFGSPTNGRGDFQASLAEHLFLNNSSQLRGVIQRRKGNLTDTLANSKDSWEQRVDRLFLSVLTRLPRPEERSRFVEFLMPAMPRPGRRSRMLSGYCSTPRSFGSTIELFRHIRIAPLRAFWRVFA